MTEVAHIPYDSIRRQAEELLLKSGFAGRFPVPVDKIAAYLGFNAYSFQPNSTTQGISGAVDHKYKGIFVNAKEPLERKIFTIAHEIGHIVLHGHDQNHIDYRSSEKNPREDQANDFAGCLLMPESVFRHQWKLQDGDLEDLAAFFGVSKLAIAVRATRLDLA